jgi:prepilin signal peptidase PulO-like enzyme (type II secretory pathway)
MSGLLETLAALLASGLASCVLRRELGAGAVLAAVAPIAFMTCLGFALLTLGAPLAIAAPVAAITAVCVLIGEIDRRHEIIPDVLVVAMLALAAVAPFEDHALVRVFGALFIGALFYAIHAGFSLAGREDALGLGDVKLALAVGAFHGAYWGLVSIALAGIGTIAAMAATYAMSRNQSAMIGAPFGVGLAAATCVVGAFRLWGTP